MKSSTDYTVLFGLRIALAHAQRSGACIEVIEWLTARIQYLEAM